MDINISDDINTIITHVKMVGSYFNIDAKKILNKEFLYSFQADLYDQSVYMSKILGELELITKYGDLEADLKELQEIELIKRDLNAQFQKIDQQLINIVKQIHKLRHETLLLSDNQSFIKKRKLTIINKKIADLNDKIHNFAKMEKQLFEDTFVTKEKIINKLINKYLINVNDINDNNDIRVIDKVKEEIKFFNSGNFYRHLVAKIDENINSLETGPLSNPLDNLDSFIFYTKGLVVACQPKLKKAREALQKLYKLHPEYQDYSRGKIKKEYIRISKVLDSLRYITDHLSLLKSIIKGKENIIFNEKI